MAQRHLTEQDEGKQVVDQNGNEVGVVSGVRGGEVYVNPDPGVVDTMFGKLGWENVDDEDYTLDQSSIEYVDPEQIRLSI